LVKLAEEIEIDTQAYELRRGLWLQEAMVSGDTRKIRAV
jgi:hypothetical protein